MKLSFLKRILPYHFSTYLKKQRSRFGLRKARHDMQRTHDFRSRSRFYKELIKKGDVYFDIGANYGNRIGPILKIGFAKVIAVEPQKNCCEHLRRFYPTIEVLQKEVGGVRTIKEFYISDLSIKFIFGGIL